MSQASRLADAFGRIATEFKTLRSDLGGYKRLRLTKTQYAQLTNKDNKTMYLITDWTAGGPLVDLFTRTDSTTSLGSTDTGQQWNVFGSGWGIISNAAYHPGGGSNEIAYQDLGTVEHYVEAKLTVMENTAAIVGRVTDINNYVAAGLDGGGQKGVFRVAAGSSSAVTLTSGTMSGIIAGDLLRMSFKGTVGTVFRNGTQIATFADSSTGTKNGLRATSSASRFNTYKSDVT